MSVSPRDLEALDRLGHSHPVLLELGKDPALGSYVPAAARTLARTLLGVPQPPDDPLSALLTVIAGPELELLASTCRAQPLKAATATARLLEQLLTRYRYLLELEQASLEQPTQLEALRSSLEALSGRRLPVEFPIPPAAALGLGTLVGPGPGPPLDRLGASLARALCVSDATTLALQAASTCDDTLATLAMLLPGYGWDFGAGHLQRTLLHQLPLLARLLERLPVLERIARELGRLEGSLKRQQKQQRRGREEVVGVRVGGELSDVLPAELALLASPVTEDLFYQRLVDHRLFCLELQGPSEDAQGGGQSRGPVIACVDTSASMQGAPEAVAKALILCVVRMVLPQGRPVSLLAFSGPGEALELELSPRARSLEPLLQFLSLGFQGGTDFDGPLAMAVERLRVERFARADILVVTDGLCSASRAALESLSLARAELAFRVVSVVVGGDRRGVEGFSDQVWEVDPTKSLEGTIDLRAWHSSPA